MNKAAIGWGLMLLGAALLVLTYCVGFSHGAYGAEPGAEDLPVFCEIRMIEDQAGLCEKYGGWDPLIIRDDGSVWGLCKCDDAKARPPQKSKQNSGPVVTIPVDPSWRSAGKGPRLGVSEAQRGSLK